MTVGIHDLHLSSDLLSTTPQAPRGDLQGRTYISTIFAVETFRRAFQLGENQSRLV